MVVNHEGLIEAIGIESSIQEKYGAATFVTQIDATGLSIVPGVLLLLRHAIKGTNRTVCCQVSWMVTLIQFGVETVCMNLR